MATIPLLAGRMWGLPGSPRRKPSSAYITQFQVEPLAVFLEVGNACKSPFIRLQAGLTELVVHVVNRVAATTSCYWFLLDSQGPSHYNSPLKKAAYMHRKWCQWVNKECALQYFASLTDP
jgi:hypothetical protein